jgi:MoxR-like ATPase
MSSGNRFGLYRGEGGESLYARQPPPLFEQTYQFESPQGYLADSSLRDAVNVALALGQPLLVTGDPGTGKTLLAASIAHELNAPLLVFHTKTTSQARDLFYRYDALSHFHATHSGKEAPDVQNYISYEALGTAILLSLERREADAFLPTELHGKPPVRSVVLIDEVDKPPRDLPNDVLDEVEMMSFEVREIGRRFRAERSYRPILVLTSNSEKNLPDAFLRRCVYYHIEFPKPDQLREIIRRRLQTNGASAATIIESAVARFLEIRALPTLKKKPATAEFLAWLQVLLQNRIDLSAVGPDQAETVQASCSILAKGKEDLNLIRNTLSQRKDKG